VGQREGESGRSREQQRRQGWSTGQRERERAGAAENNGADRVGPRDREGDDRADERTAPTSLAHGTVGADRRGPPVKHRGRAGAGARVGLGRFGLNGPKWLFLFPGNF
jgi:hypothetical protein